MWKRLKHRNIVPFLGITPNPLQLISEWMPGGDLTEYIKNYPSADRLNLASTLAVMFHPTLTPVTSYLMSLKAFASSTPAILFTAISEGYVVGISPILRPDSHVPSQISSWMMPATHGS